MGDMADYFLDQAYDMEEYRLNYMFNQDEEEAYERGVVDENRTLYSPYSKVSKTCRCCGKTGLTWGKVNGKFRLFEGTAVHECSVNPLRKT